MSYKAPELKITTTRLYAMVFAQDNLAAGSNTTLLAGPIPFNFRIVNIKAVFRNDAANLTRIYVFQSNNSSLGTTGPPPDTNVLGPYSPSGYLLGEGLILDIDLDYPVNSGQYVKVHCQNNCAYVQTMNVIVTIAEAV